MKAVVHSDVANYRSKGGSLPSQGSLRKLSAELSHLILISAAEAFCHYTVRTSPYTLKRGCHPFQSFFESNLLCYP